MPVPQPRADGQCAGSVISSGSRSGSQQLVGDLCHRRYDDDNFQPALATSANDCRRPLNRLCILNRCSAELHHYQLFTNDAQAITATVGVAATPNLSSLPNNARTS